MPHERVELEKRVPSSEVTMARHVYPGDGYAEMYIDSYSRDYGYGYGEKERGSSINLAELWRAAHKRRWLVMTITAVVTIIVSIEAFRIRPNYSASSIVEIRKDNSMLTIPSGDSDPQNAISINTKKLLFDSRPLLEDVVVRLKLDENPKFVDVAQKRSWWETFGTIFNRDKAPDQPDASSATVNKAPVLDRQAFQAEGEIAGAFVENERLDRYVGVLQNGLKVQHLPETQALKVTFTHTDPTIAAAVANGITQIFIMHNFKTKVDRFTDTAEWLKTSTRELEAKVQRAEKELADYTRDHGIFSAQGQETLTTSKLVRLHEQAMRAEVDLLLKESLYEEVKRGRVAHLPEAFSDSKIGMLQTKLNELTVQAAQFGVSYGPENPKVQDVQQQINEIQKQIDASRSSLEEKLKIDYERAVRDNQSLKAALERAKAEAVQQDQSGIQYNILKQNLETAKSLYTEFLHKTNQANLEVAQQQNNINVIQPAQVPKAPGGPRRGLAILFGFMLSLAGSVGLAFILERFDNTIKNIGDVSRYTQLPTLGVIPAIDTRTARMLSEKVKKKKQIGANETGSNGKDASGDFPIRFMPPAEGKKKSNGVSGNRSVEFNHGQMIVLDEHSSVAEAYRALRTSVLLSAAGRPPKTILVTSSEPGEGKTTTVINTAISLAQLGASVLIIDADLRKPTTHKGFGIKRELGLSTFLSGEVEVEGMIQTPQIPNVSLLPCGLIPPNPAELISSDRMKELLRILAERYDHILIDSPPLMYVTDPVILSTMVDGVILVVHGGKSRRDVVRQSRTLLSNVGAKIFGVVLNNVDLRHQAYGYYQQYSEYGNKGEEKVSDILR